MYRETALGITDQLKSGGGEGGGAMQQLLMADTMIIYGKVPTSVSSLLPDVVRSLPGRSGKSGLWPVFSTLRELERPTS